MALPRKLLLNSERRWCLPVRALKGDSALPQSVLQTVLQVSLSSLDNLTLAFQNNNKTTAGHQIAFFLRNSIINTWSNRWEGRSSITRFKSKKGKGQKSPSNHIDIKCQKENNSPNYFGYIIFLKDKQPCSWKMTECLLIYLPFHFHTTHQFYNPFCERRVSFCMLANLVAKFIQVNLVHRVGC